MATRAPKAASEVLEPEGGEWRMPVETPTPEQTEEDEILARVRATVAEVGTDRVRIKVYRSANGSTEWLDDLQFDEWADGGLKLLRDRFGPGRFMLRIYGPTGLIARPDIRIADLPQRNPIALAAPAPVIPSELTRAIEVLAQGQQAIIQALGQRPDPMAQAQTTFALMAQMRAAMGLDKPAPPPAPAADPMAMMTQLIGAVRAMKEISSEINPPAVDPSDPMALLPSILDTVKTLATARDNPQAIEPLALPSSIGDSVTPSDSNPEPDMRALLAQLVNMAQSGASIDAGADFVWQNLPESVQPYLKMPQWFELLCTFEGKCAAHRPWLTGVRDQVVQWLAESESTPGKTG